MLNNVFRSAFVLLCVFGSVLQAQAASDSQLDSRVNSLLGSGGEISVKFASQLPDGLNAEIASEGELAGQVEIIISAEQAAAGAEAVVKFASADRIARFWGKNVLSGKAADMLDGASANINGIFAVQSSTDSTGLVVSVTDDTGQRQDALVTLVKGGLLVGFNCDGAVKLRLRSFVSDMDLALSGAADQNAQPSILPEDNTEIARSDKSVDKVFTPWVAQGRRLEKYSNAAETQWLRFADQDRLFRPLLADQREAQTRLTAGRFFGNGGYYKKPFEVSFGGDLVLMRRKFSPEQLMSISVRGAIASRFDIGGNEPNGGNFPLLNTDFFGGVAVAYKKGCDTFELYGYHQSAHLGDETVLNNEYEIIDVFEMGDGIFSNNKGDRWQNYSREALRFLWSRDIDQLRLYGGGTFNPTSDNKDMRYKLGLQCGAEYKFEYWDQPFYAAADIQAWQYHDFQPSINTQIGWYYDKPENNPLNLRVFLEYFYGHSTMGHFWDEEEQTIMLGAGMNF